MASGTTSLFRSVVQLNRLLFTGASRSHLFNSSNIISRTTTLNNRTLFSTTKGTAQPDNDQPETTDGEKLLAEKDEQVEKYKQEASDLKDKYVRALAESENIRRRGVKQTSDAKLYAIQGLTKDLLGVADILELATGSVDEQARTDNQHLSDLYQGVKMTEVELQKVFNKHGLEKIDPLDEPFDPNYHEAMFQIPMEGKSSGTVAVVQKVGYKLNGRPLRAAQVGVVP